ncbi:hypothetical protein [Cellulomonas bogoriensis]|uniref:hypothetical protein n=1 Tax=Cellulomonas bogoriensis TaxID=301388 RepID=UPI000A8C8192|nr:hypothetical protein [Cellulomonas bogoriensis]
MSSHPHTCVYFDDGEFPELVCVCGRRTVHLIEDEADGILIVLVEEPELAATA